MEKLTEQLLSMKNKLHVHKRKNVWHNVCFFIVNIINWGFNLSVNYLFSFKEYKVEYELQITQNTDTI